MIFFSGGGFDEEYSRYVADCIFLLILNEVYCFPGHILNTFFLQVLSMDRMLFELHASNFMLSDISAHICQ